MPSNIESDIFYKAYLDRKEISARYNSLSQEAIDLLHGYVDGYNRYLATTPSAERPQECGNSPWLKPITIDDLFLLMTDQMIRGSIRGWISQIVRAAPPSAGDNGGNVGFSGSQWMISGGGGNSIALGRDVTAGMTGILLGDMIFPWNGEDRFYEMHLTIPGRLNVMGATLLPFPAVIAGFNQKVAWTHTLLPDRPNPLFELTLVPGDPLRYKFDGKTLPIERKTVSVEVREPDGSTHFVQGGIFLSRYGPLVIGPYRGVQWSEKHAFAVRDVMLANTRALEQWLRIDRASSVEDIEQSIQDVQGIPWMNTVAADRYGNTLFSDASVTPNISHDLLRNCQPSSGALAIARKVDITILDGSRSDCDLEGSNAPQTGIKPAAEMLSAIRADYVISNNGPPRLANLEHPIDGKPLQADLAGSGWDLRTRMGYIELEHLISRKAGNISASDVQSLITDGRDLAAEMVLDDLVSVCREGDTVYLANGDSINISTACATLETWDRRDNASSRGAALFRQIWHRMDNLDELWNVPFDPRDPIGTPRSLKLSTELQHQKIREDIAEAVQFFQQQHMELDVPLGSVQTWETRAGFIPLDGGYGSEGVLNRLVIGFPGSDSSRGGPVIGSAFLQIVTWGPEGPICHALLPYGQSVHKSSIHYSDQALLLALKEWPLLPFSEADVHAEMMTKLEFRN